MLHILLEGIRTILSSISFGMDDRYDRLIRKTTTLIVLFGKTKKHYFLLYFISLPISKYFLGAFIIASNRFFGSPISCATTELPIGIPQHWIDTVCWLTDKKYAPIQIIGNTHSRKPTLVSLLIVIFSFIFKFF